MHREIASDVARQFSRLAYGHLFCERYDDDASGDVVLQHQLDLQRARCGGPVRTAAPMVRGTRSINAACPVAGHRNYTVVFRIRYEVVELAGTHQSSKPAPPR